MHVNPPSESVAAQMPRARDQHIKLTKQGSSTEASQTCMAAIADREGTHAREACPSRAHQSHAARSRAHGRMDMKKNKKREAEPRAVSLLSQLISIFHFQFYPPLNQILVMIHLGQLHLTSPTQIVVTGCIYFQRLWYRLSVATQRVRQLNFDFSSPRPIASSDANRHFLIAAATTKDTFERRFHVLHTILKY